MKINKICIVILLLLFSTNVGFTANWKYVKDKLYIDINSVQAYSNNAYTTSNKFSLWEKHLNDKSEIFTYYEKLYGKQIWYYLGKIIIDCDNKSYAYKSFIYYDLKHNVVKNDEFSYYTYRWISIPPDTVSALYYNLVCKPKY